MLTTFGLQNVCGTAGRSDPKGTTSSSCIPASFHISSFQSEKRSTTAQWSSGLSGQYLLLASTFPGPVKTDAEGDSRHGQRGLPRDRPRGGGRADSLVADRVADGRRLPGA